MELSSIAGVHPSHLARKFRSCYKKSIGEYLRQRRVDVAIDLLVGSNLSLTEIALATGFAHHAHFMTRQASDGSTSQRIPRSSKVGLREGQSVIKSLIVLALIGALLQLNSQ